jgi:hypothetical protein
LSERKRLRLFAEDDTELTHFSLPVKRQSSKP